MEWNSYFPKQIAHPPKVIHPQNRKEEIYFKKEEK